MNEANSKKLKETLDPHTLVLISAAVSVICGNIHVHRVKLISTDVRQAGAWGQAGRKLLHGSHVVKK